LIHFYKRQDSLDEFCSDKLQINKQAEG